MAVTTDTRRLNQLIREADDRSQRFVNSVGFKVEQLAKMKSPVDTGANRNSIFTRTPDTILSQGVEEELPNPDDQHVIVGPTMEYSIFLEMGTHKMLARPYLVPALREVERELEGRARIIIE
jgi:HK97 gp10 family phage protein